MDYFLGTWFLDGKRETFYLEQANSTVFFFPKQVYDESGCVLQERETFFCVSGIVLGMAICV